MHNCVQLTCHLALADRKTEIHKIPAANSPPPTKRTVRFSIRYRASRTQNGAAEEAGHVMLGGLPVKLLSALFHVRPCVCLTRRDWCSLNCRRSVGSVLFFRRRRRLRPGPRLRPFTYAYPKTHGHAISSQTAETGFLTLTAYVSDFFLPSHTAPRVNTEFADSFACEWQMNQLLRCHRYIRYIHSDP